MIGAKLAAMLALPALLAWWIYVSNFDYWVARSTLRMRRGNEGSEALWREHLSDVPERVWNAVLWNEGILFDEDEQRKAKPSIQ